MQSVASPVQTNEYSSMFESSPPPPVSVTPKPVAAPMKTRQLQLFIALGVLFLIAVIVVVFFVVWARPPVATQ